MNRKELRKIIIEAITEAETKTQTDVDAAVQAMLDDLDLDLDDASLVTTTSSDPDTTDDDLPPVRGLGGSFDDILRGDDLKSFVAGILRGPAPEGNFKDEFSAAAARAQKNKARFQGAPAVDNDLDLYDDVPDFVGTQTPPTKRFQTSQPSYAGEPGLKQKSSGDPSAEIERVLMDEFVTPAMAVGQTVLHTVWDEIKRLAKEPGFEDAFHIALNGIRNDENIFFQNLLKVDLSAKQMPAPAESKTLVGDLRNVLSQYYNLVIGEAQKNKHLLRKMYSIRNRYTDEAFRKGFAKAIQKSRAKEDLVFGQFLGSSVDEKLPLDEKLSLHETLLYNSLNDDILLRVSRKV